jgi:Acetyltransferase (GNAT) domain
MPDGRELFTRRLHLRPPASADGLVISGIAGDWEVARRLGRVPHPISLVPHSKSRSAELGYYVGRPHWGQGLATEAGQAVVRIGLEDMGCKKLARRPFGSPVPRRREKQAVDRDGT